MPFNVTIKNVGEHQLGDLFAKLGNKVYDIQVQHIDGGDVGKLPGKKASRNARGYMTPDDVVLLGDIEQASAGSLYEKIHQIVQRLEKKHGIGTVLRSQLTEELGKYSNAPGVAINMARKKGIIKKGKRKKE